MDFYINQKNVVNRLLEEYKLHGDLVIAYDFDNTVFDSYKNVIELIKRLNKIKGMEFVVWTGSAKERYEFVGNYLKENDIPFNRINANPYFFNSSSPKIFYSILLDDRAGLESAYKALVEFCEIIENE
jgi:hypothetical protein